MMSRSSMPLRRCAGFTLVELIIVVLVLAIAATIALPMLGGMAGTRLRAAGQLLAADLAYAQVESIAHGDDLRVVVFDTAAAQYHIAAASEPDTPITNPVGKLPYVVQFGTGRAAELTDITIQSVSVGGDDVLGFGIYGQLDQTSNASITLASEGKTVTVSVDAVTGEASIGPLQ